MFHPFRPLVYTQDAIAEYGEPTRLSSDRSPGSHNPISVKALYAGYEPGSYLRGEHRCRAMVDRDIMAQQPEAYVEYRIERPSLPDLDGMVGVLDLDAAVVHMHEGVMASGVAARSADIERAGAFLEPVVLATEARGDDGVHETPVPMRSVAYGEEVHTVRAIPTGRGSEQFVPFPGEFVVIDGHHRIVAAREHARVTGESPWILAMVIDIDSPGLFVAPQHRVLGGSSVTIDRLPDIISVSPYLRGSAVPPGDVAIVGRDTSIAMSRLDMEPGAPEDRISSVTLSKHILDHLDLWVQGFATREADAYTELDSGAAAVAIMGDLDISDIVATAAKGLVLPEKTTCFNPKVAVGLVGALA